MKKQSEIVNIKMVLLFASLRRVGKAMRMTKQPSMAMGSSSNLVTCEKLNDGQVAIIRLNCPEKLNALTEPIGDALISTVQDLVPDSNLRVAILTGSGI
jgi:1,4-dihydroxy-2-naphthoyl-CoA synthase